MKKGFESWGCSAWRREGFGQTLLWPSSIYRGLVRKMGTNFLAESVVIGEAVMVLNREQI